MHTCITSLEPAPDILSPVELVQYNITLKTTYHECVRQTAGIIVSIRIYVAGTVRCDMTSQGPIPSAPPPPYSSIAYVPPPSAGEMMYAIS